MISVDDARALVTTVFPPLAARRVPLGDSFGCVAAERVVAAEPLPPVAVSAMDGYALRSGDTGAGAPDSPVALAVVGTQLAGPALGLRVGPGEAIRIMTGAPLPEGADAVLVLEQARFGTERSLLVGQPVPVRANIRRPGEDVGAGDALLEAGEVLGPARMALLAEAGVAELAVVPAPLIGVLSNGDELIDPGRPSQPGCIRDANRVLLAAMLHAAGFATVDLGIAADDEEAIASALLVGASCCDAIVTTAGVSAGDRDLLPRVLDELSGGTARRVQVALRPGKPLAVGSIGLRHVPVLCLPGNPVAAGVSMQLIGLPALRRRGGLCATLPAQVAVCEAAIARRPDGKLHALLAVATTASTGVLTVKPSERQGSHLLSALARANALVLLPDGAGVSAGERVEVVLLAGVPVPPGVGGGRAHRSSVGLSGAQPYHGSPAGAGARR